MQAGPGASKPIGSTVITFLEMHSPAELLPKRSSDRSFVVAEAVVRQWPFNRFLYSYVGGDWAWCDKREWTDAQWQSYVESDALRTFVASYGGAVAGYYELHKAANGGVQIAYFGLTPAFIGRGCGGALLTHAIESAWSWETRRVWVHTCTEDHPAALPNYLARGMRVFEVRKGVPQTEE